MLEALPTLSWLLLLSGVRYFMERRPPPAAQLMRVAWFLCITVHEWSLLRDQPWLPAFLGGNDESGILEASWDPPLVSLYEIQLGYHLQSMLFSLVLGAKPEMHLHHVNTVVLIMCSWQFGYLRIGSVVFLLHDLPDICGYVMQAVVESQLKQAMVASFVLLVITWGYSRLFLFFRLVLYVYEMQHLLTPPVFISHFVMLCILLALHYYWYMMFFKMALTFKSKGRTQDISEVRSLGLPTGPALTKARAD